MSRMVGGTFGVAAIGALFQSLAHDRVAQAAHAAGVSPGMENELVENLGSGRAEEIARQLEPATAERLTDGMHEAFVHALGGALTLSAAVAAAGVVIALVLVAPKKAAPGGGREAPARGRRARGRAVARASRRYHPARSQATRRSDPQHGR